ncbi:MAG: hypothetical protein AAF517_01225 [Planctomycetota bacterium]
MSKKTVASVSLGLAAIGVGVAFVVSSINTPCLGSAYRVVAEGDATIGYLRKKTGDVWLRVLSTADSKAAGGKVNVSAGDISVFDLARAYVDLTGREVVVKSSVAGRYVEFDSSAEGLGADRVRALFRRQGVELCPCSLEGLDLMRLEVNASSERIEPRSLGSLSLGASEPRQKILVR